MKINPVYKKELRISVRTVKMAFIIFFYNLLLAIIGLFAFYLSFEESAMYGGIDYSNMLSIYTTIAVLEICLVLFIVPGFTSSSITGERERQTLEILLTTKLKPIEIVLGKLGSSISSLLLLVFSSLPILAISFAVGGIRFIDLLQLMLLAIVIAVFIGSIGIFFSTIARKTTSATVFTYGTVIVLILGTAAIVFAAYLLISFKMGKQYASGGVYNAPDVGNLILILLVNPIVTMIAMITDQFGNYSEFAKILSEYGKGNSTIIENWFVVSVILQLVLSAAFILGAARFLNPLRKRRRGRGKRDSLEG